MSVVGSKRVTDHPKDPIREALLAGRSEKKNDDEGGPNRTTDRAICELSIDAGAGTGTPLPQTVDMNHMIRATRAARPGRRL